MSQLNTGKGYLVQQYAAVAFYWGKRILEYEYEAVETDSLKAVSLCRYLLLELFNPILVISEKFDSVIQAI